jgi:hypothetical protein
LEGFLHLAGIRICCCDANRRFILFFGHMAAVGLGTDAAAALKQVSALAGSVGWAHSVELALS